MWNLAKALAGAAPWFILFTWLGIAALTPAKQWMQVRKLYVQDSVVGVSPSVSIDWTIKQDFVVHWTTTVRVAQGYASAFRTVCVCSNGARYFPGRVIPETTTLSWWMGAQACDLTAGVYYLEAIWSWEWMGIQREIVVHSNVFKVKEN